MVSFTEMEKTWWMPLLGEKTGVYFGYVYNEIEERTGSWGSGSSG